MVTRKNRLTFIGFFIQVISGQLILYDDYQCSVDEWKDVLSKYVDCYNQLKDEDVEECERINRMVKECSEDVLAKCLTPEDMRRANDATIVLRMQELDAEGGSDSYQGCPPVEDFVSSGRSLFMAQDDDDDDDECSVEMAEREFKKFKRCYDRLSVNLVAFETQPPLTVPDPQELLCDFFYEDIFDFCVTDSMLECFPESVVLRYIGTKALLMDLDLEKKGILERAAYCEKEDDSEEED